MATAKSFARQWQGLSLAAVVLPIAIALLVMPLFDFFRRGMAWAGILFMFLLSGWLPSCGLCPSAAIFREGRLCVTR